MPTIDDNQAVPKVFISYTHEATQEHAQNLLRLSNRLREESGFDADIDQYYCNQDWPLWMERSIEEAQFVLVVCTSTYLRRWNQQEKPGVGLGARWESLLTRHHLYKTEGLNKKFIPIILQPQDRDCIPAPLTNVTRIDLFLEDGYSRLVNRLNNLPPAAKPPLRKSLSPIELAPAFFDSPTAQVISNHLSTGFGIYDAPETLWSNLLPIEYPPVIRRYKAIRRKNIAPLERLKDVCIQNCGLAEVPVQNFLIDDGIVLQFEEGTEEPQWRQMVSRGYAERLPSLKSDSLALSPNLADQSVFIKLLNRRLEAFCADKTFGSKKDGVYLKRAGKPLNCFLFTPPSTNKLSKLKTKAISREGTRTVVQPIYKEKGDSESGVQHWKHVAFRHKFLRFDGVWNLSIIPIWAFTLDGFSIVSPGHRTSARNMKKPERNRAVLGHIAFWASILCNPADDLFCQNDQFRICPPLKVSATPSIQDRDWIQIDDSAEQSVLNYDLKLELFIS